MRPAILFHSYYSNRRSVFDDLISYWGFNENEYGLPYDSSGVNNISLITNATQVDGKIGQAYRFTGSVSYLTVPDAANLSFNGGSPDLPFAFALWCRPTNSSTTRWLLGKRQQSSSHCEYQSTRLSDGTIRVNFFSGGGNAVYLQVTTNGICPENEYSFLVVSYDGSGTASGIKVWIDATPQELTNASVGTYAGLQAGAGDLILGGQPWNLATSTSGFIGDLDEIGLFNKDLTQDDVDYLYNEGDGRENPDTPMIYYIDLNIHAVRDNYQFASNGSDLLWSDDGGETWINNYNWGAQWSSGRVYNKYIDSAYIFSDGTLLFSCGALLFRSTDKLLNIDSVTPLLEDGEIEFPIHTPADAALPGAYFQRNHYDRNAYDDVLAWINYGNTSTGIGAAPATIWYTTDKGVTVKPAYRFGQHANYRDDGTPDGGNSGTLLGDSGNAIVTRHGHQMIRHYGTNDWYFNTGDSDSGNEVHWFKLTYNPGNDTWTVSHLINDATSNTKWKGTGMAIIDGYMYWTSDASGEAADSEKGIFKTLLADLPNQISERVIDDGIAEHSQLSINPTTGKMIWSVFNGTADEEVSVLIAENFGPAYTAYKLLGAAESKRPALFSSVTTDGYIKVNIGRNDEECTRTAFVKA